MKKIFRMQYEECLGTCYCYDDIFKLELSRLKNDKDFNILLDNLDYIHGNSCGDREIGFHIDYDENLFIGTFLYHGKTHSFVANGLMKLYEKFKNLMENYSNTEEYRQYSNKDKSACDHGRDENIKEFTLAMIS